MKTKHNSKHNLKKLLPFLLLFVTIASGQTVNIPDANFKAALLSASTTNQIASNSNGNNVSIDINSDGEIQISEALLIYSLNLNNSNISNFAGIEEFINLKAFDCSNSNLSNLDLSIFPEIEYFGCYGNQLTNLDLISLPSLKFVDISTNLISFIDLTGLTNLMEFRCDNNLLTSLNLYSCTNLKSLSCLNNFFTSLDISNQNLSFLNYGNIGFNSLIGLENSTDLHDFFVTNSSEIEIDLSSKPNLWQIGLTNTQFTNIDVTGSPRLISFYLNNNNNIRSIFLKNGGTLDTGILISNCPLLEYACADVNSLPTVLAQVGSNVVVNSYCSFTPGGNYNTITGNVKFDANNNGCDALDLPQPNVRVNINDGTTQGATFTNNSGNYTFYNQAGNFALEPSVENPSWFNFSPANANIIFADNNNNTNNQNFCVSANGVHSDLEVTISPIVSARPGLDATYKIVYKNKGNQTLSGNITFTYNDDVLDFVSATVNPDTQSVGLLNWNYLDLLPFENRSLYITLNVNTPTEVPAVNIDDILNFEATITPVIGDEIPDDNLFNYSQTVVGSYDPNNIECIEGDVVPPTEIGKYLHYVINFENTGNYQAENVVVRDEIDTTKYDISTLQIMNTSHPSYTRITGNVVEFIFEGINLAAVGGNPPVGGHGDILFKIKSKSDLASGDSVSKTANIYFDYNAPITTNDAITTFELLNNPIHQFDNQVSIYPNPAKSVININSKSEIKSIELYDVQGRIIETIIGNKNNIDISEKSNGVYFLKITTDLGSKVEKIVKE